MDSASPSPEKVVVGLDGSAASRAAFHKAVSEAAHRGAEVRAVHVFGTSALMNYDMAAGDVTDLRERAVRWLAEEIELLAEEYEVDAPVPIRSEIRMGHTGRELIAAGEGAEMLVLGTRGHGGFRGLLVGSVTTYLIHHLPCPVLVVPAPAEEHKQA